MKSLFLLVFGLFVEAKSVNQVRIANYSVLQFPPNLITYGRKLLRYRILVSSVILNVIQMATILSMLLKPCANMEPTLSTAILFLNINLAENLDFSLDPQQPVPNARIKIGSEESLGKASFC